MFTMLAAENNITKQLAYTMIEDEWLSLSDGDEFLLGVDLSIHGAFFEDEERDFYSEIEQLVSEGKTEEICQITGYILLAEEAMKHNYEPYEVCDAYSGDLESMYSVIKEFNLKYDEDEFHLRNILYIHEIKWNREIDEEIRKKIFNHLKDFVFENYHVRIDLISFYTAPLDSYVRPSTLTNEKETMLIDKISKQLYDDDNNDDENILDLSNYAEFTEEELNERMGIRSSGESYPKEFINMEEYKEFIGFGFTELGETRLLVRTT